MGFVQEFKTFISKGNVVDLAVGVIIGAAFGKIVSSLVADVIMPPIGLLISGVNFSAIKFVIQTAVVDSSGKVITEEVAMRFGLFFQIVLEFLIVAFVIFMAIKTLSRME